MLTIRSRAIAAAAVAVLALTTLGNSTASAGSRGNAAALAAVVGLFATVAAIAAANVHDERYDRPHYGAPGYGGRTHDGLRWGDRHRRHWSR
jgi:hypothetical protein